VALIGDRYRLVKPIATGGMGTVWEGWDERLQRRVAIKQLHPPQPGLDPEAARVAAERVLREARNAARLHHPHAVPVYDVVDDEGRPCLVMQYLPAQSLQQVLAARGPLDIPTVARIGSEVASALEAAHQVGIVHRDVKPGNVLIDGEGTAKLTDFGISHAMGDPSLTSTGLVTGTPAYLAPEVARGAPATPASDVFSLGATLFTALEGVSPFGDGQNAMATLHRAAAPSGRSSSRSSWRAPSWASSSPTWCTDRVAAARARRRRHHPPARSTPRRPTPPPRARTPARPRREPTPRPRRRPPRRRRPHRTRRPPRAPRPAPTRRAPATRPARSPATTPSCRTTPTRRGTG
jgi:serine/threonine protein kinase